MVGTWHAATMQVRDLLGKDHSKKMELKESPDRGVYVKDLSQFVCKNYEEMNKVLLVRASPAHVPAPTASLGLALDLAVPQRAHTQRFVVCRWRRVHSFKPRVAAAV